MFKTKKKLNYNFKLNIQCLMFPIIQKQINSSVIASKYQSYNCKISMQIPISVFILQFLFFFITNLDYRL
jgi:hypothetical protein